MLSEIHSGADSSMPLSQRYQLKQVEVNTIAAGFGWLGPASGHLQRFFRFKLFEKKMDFILLIWVFRFAMGELSQGDKLAQVCSGKNFKKILSNFSLEMKRCQRIEPWRLWPVQC